MTDHKPIWELAGIARLDWVKLSWPEKRKHLIKHNWVKVMDAEHDKRFPDHKAPEKTFSGSYLLDAHFRENAETIKITKEPALEQREVL